MYAIRSYYEVLLESSDVDHRRDQQHEQEHRDQIAEPVKHEAEGDAVITSYSIHYTKLYDEARPLTARDREIAEALAPVLAARGLLFVGIDVIGDWLTEINVTSPTGIQELERFDGTNSAELIWRAIEARRG